jgi:hypothetical protein
MRTIQQRTAGSATAGAPARSGPVCAGHHRTHLPTPTAT